MSLLEGKIHHCFKKATIDLVPKKSTAFFNDYRLGALTSVIMKTLERLVLQFLKSIIHPLLDRFQFVCRVYRYVDDAVSLGLFYIFQYLDGPDTYARIIFVDDYSCVLIQLSPQTFLMRYRMAESHNSCL